MEKYIPFKYISKKYSIQNRDKEATLILDKIDLKSKIIVSVSGYYIEIKASIQEEDKNFINIYAPIKWQDWKKQTIL